MLLISESSLKKKRRLSKEYKLARRLKKNGNLNNHEKNFKLNTVENVYFNTIDSSRIEFFMHTDPYFAKEYAEDYMLRFPQDCYIKGIYIQILIILKQMDFAKEKLDELTFLLNNDPAYLKLEERADDIAHQYFFTKLKYLLYSHNYEEAYEYVLFNYDYYPDMGLDRILYYIKSVLKIDGYDCYDGDLYSLHQISHYSEKEMLSHIKKHMSAGNHYKDIPNSNIFVTDFPIESVLDEIRQRFDPKYAVYNGLIEDVYFFKYDDCGKYENKYVDYIKVICYHNTFDIITMLPVKDYPKGFCIDLNYLKDCKKKIKCD